MDERGSLEWATRKVYETSETENWDDQFSDVGD